MHICFHIGDDVDFNQFIRDLEAECARRGMTNVKANRVIAVSTEQARAQAPLDSNTNKITGGQFDGLAMMYAKGPEGEQLEFLQVLGRAKAGVRRWHRGPPPHAAAVSLNSVKAHR